MRQTAGIYYILYILKRDIVTMCIIYNNRDIKSFSLILCNANVLLRVRDLIVGWQQ